MHELWKRERCAEHVTLNGTGQTRHDKLWSKQTQPLGHRQVNRIISVTYILAVFRGRRLKGQI